MLGRLPDSITIHDTIFKLRTDYRNVLDTFVVFNDPELSLKEKWFTTIYMMIDDFSCYENLEQAIINGFDCKEACKQLEWFFCAGKSDEKAKTRAPLYDWEQDEQIIFASVNHVANKELREIDYLHWWTFLAYFNEIGEGLFSYVVSIRKKRSKGQKLDKAEQQFLRENPGIVELKKKHTLEEQQFFDEISELL